MARTVEGAALTREHVAQQLALRAGSLRDLLALWRMVDPTDLSGTIGTFVRAAVILAGARYADSAGLAAGYYRLFRAAERVPGAATPVLAQPLPADVMAAQIRGAALAGIIDSRRAGRSLEVASRDGFVRAAGALTKLILTGGRMTLLHSVAADRQATGWARVTSGAACAFCRMLASRGPAYRAERSARFEAHDSCGCTVEPAYAGDRPSEQALAYRREWEAAQKLAAQQRMDGERVRSSANPALNAYRRYLAGGGE